MKNDIRNRVFKWLGIISAKYYWLIIIIALILTIGMGRLAEKLRLDMTWMSMAPQKSESVKQFKKIVEEFGDANPVIVTIKGDNPEQLKRAAEEIALDYKNLKEDIKDVNFKVNMTFTKKYGLLLQKAKDLKRFQNLLVDFNLDKFYKNLNNDFEKEYIEESKESLNMQEKNAVQFLDTLKDVLYSYKAYLINHGKENKDLKHSIDKFTYGEEYFLSRNKDMIILFVQPYVSMTDIDRIIPVIRKSEEILNKYRNKYKELQFGQTGMSVISRDEMDAGLHDTKVNMITAAIAILLLLSLSFRMIAAPFLSMISLLLGITWDLGIIYIAFARLNLMTAMVGVILIGLGIDYAIHLITGYTQNRYKGLSQQDALISTYQKSGPGLLTGALTTAIAFLVFMVSDIEMMQELGFAMGIGIICTFLASVLVLPSLIIAKEKIQKLFKYKKLNKTIPMEYVFLGKMGEKVIKHPKIIIGAALFLTIISLIVIPKLHFISDLKKLEVRGLLSLDLIDDINDKFDMSPDPVHIITKSIKDMDEKTEKLFKLNSVGYIDSLALYLPPQVKQKKRIPYILKLKNILMSQPALQIVSKEKLIKQIRRLEHNIIEIGDMAYMSGLDKLVKRSDELANIIKNKKAGKNVFDELIEIIKKSDITILNSMQEIFANGLKQNFLKMCNTEMITLNDVPQNIKNLFISKDGKSYLINVYSAKDIWKNLFTTSFLNDVKKVSSKITGASVFMYDVIKYSSAGGKQATILAFIAIFLLLLLDFKNIKFTLISLIPLILGSIWILGFLVFSNIYFTWMTIMIVPLIIGIGIDDGVHIIHRYRLEGKRNIPLVLRTTGKAVMLTSLTTMIGFGSLSFSKMVGYQQFGIALFVGIGVLFILSTVLLPVILNLFEKK